jgi:hypothetical protein
MPRQLLAQLPYLFPPILVVRFQVYIVLSKILISVLCYLTKPLRCPGSPPAEAEQFLASVIEGKGKHEGLP